MRRTTVLFFLLAGVVALLAANFWRLSNPPPPDPRLVDISVRSTLFAVPTPTAIRIEVTRMVTVTRVVEVVATATPISAPNAATPPAAPVTATTGLSTGLVMPASDVASASALRAMEATTVAAGDVAAGDAAAVDDVATTAAGAVEVVDPEPAALVSPAPVPVPSCPATSARGYESIPVDSPPIEHPDSIHGDLNLWQRGWSPVDAARSLVNIDGPADGDAPQLAGLFASSRLPEFVSTFQVFDWDWGCDVHGCRGALLTDREVLLLGLRTSAGESLSIPTRDSEIYGGGFRALVLYAEPQRITLGYTREDSVANGYTVHLENLCVDPGLVALYQANNAAGRSSLPALRNGETLGVAAQADLLVAVRDRGVFLDPRSRKDWWRGY